MHSAFPIQQKGAGAEAGTQELSFTSDFVPNSSLPWLVPVSPFSFFSITWNYNVCYCKILLSNWKHYKHIWCYQVNDHCFKHYEHMTYVNIFCHVTFRQGNDVQTKGVFCLFVCLFVSTVFYVLPSNCELHQ